MSDLGDRVRQVELLILDVDGVLTDGRLYYSDRGTELKGFSTQDGAALKMLKASGVASAVITGRRSDLVARRVAELGIDHYYAGVADKAEALEELVRASGLGAHRMAHVGDDVPDLPLFNRVAVRFSVPGAHPVILERADYTATAPAGFGAVREICQFLMTEKGTWSEALAAYDR